MDLIFKGTHYPWINLQQHKIFILNVDKLNQIK